jgi:hypothetical protein
MKMFDRPRRREAAGAHWLSMRPKKIEASPAMFLD